LMFSCDAADGFRQAGFSRLVVSRVLWPHADHIPKHFFCILLFFRETACPPTWLGNVRGEMLVSGPISVPGTGIAYISIMDGWAGRIEYSAVQYAICCC